MKTYISCKTTAKDQQTFYLMHQGEKYFLFSQPFRRSNKQVFEQKVSLSDLRKLKKHCSFSVRHTANKLPTYIHYVEQEFGVLVMEATKRKQTKPRSFKVIEDEFDYDLDVA